MHAELPKLPDVHVTNGQACIPGYSQHEPKRTWGQNQGTTHRTDDNVVSLRTRPPRRHLVGKISLTPRWSWRQHPMGAGLIQAGSGNMSLVRLAIHHQCGTALSFPFDGGHVLGLLLSRACLRAAVSPR